MRIAAALLIALAVPALAQDLPKTPPGVNDAEKIVPGSYAVDPNHTQILFTVDHLGFSNFTGQIGQPTGTLVLDPKQMSNTNVDVTIPIDHLMTTVPALDAKLKSADFFDAAKFPTARFISSRVVLNGWSALIPGSLTIHGVTQAVVLKAKLGGTGINPATGKPTVGFEGRITLKRSDFGLATGVPLVSDRVDILINASFDKK